MVFNSWANTPLTIEEDLFTTCADRTASNTNLCLGGNEGTRYGGYILFKGLGNYYRLENGRFQEFLDGTAHLTGQWINIEEGDIKFDVDIKFSGRTNVAPNEPKEHSCLNENAADFYYYPQILGTIKGLDKAAGARLEVSKSGPAFQVGVGANVTHNELTFGASGWLVMAITEQPTTGLTLELQTTSAGGNGDININLSGNAATCFDSNITLECSVDLTTVAQLGASGKVVTWTPPVATTTCMIGSGSTCTSSNLSGFEYLGEYNGSSYYCSEGDNHTWLEARDIAIAAGGHLAVVCNQAENDFLRNGLLADYAWIGYADYVTEGDFKWVTGDDCGYTNWNSGEPNNSGDGEDFARLLKSNGKWTDRNEGFKAEFIMEIPCQGNMEPSNVVTTQVAGPAPGSVFPIGMTEIEYEATDECGNVESCSFKVTVVETVDPCGGDGSPVVEVEETNPDCGQNNGKIRFTFNDNSGRTNIEFSMDGGQTYPLNVLDPEGMAMFSDLASGTYNIAVRWGNGECPVDLGSVTLEDIRQLAGTACNDENANTINDVIAADGCTCGGTPIGAIDLVCADDIGLMAEAGEEGILIILEEPTASTTCGLDGLTIEQIEGLTSGSLFPIGTTTITYRVTDACGNMEVCSFDIVIETSPLIFDILCVDDITTTAEIGDNGAEITFNAPSAISNCPDNSLTVTQTGGLFSGSVFPVGVTTVTFEVTDECGQSDDCSFDVTVNPAPTGEITFACNDDIIVTETVSENDGVVVTFNDPTATTTCSLGGLEVEQTAGLASGSTFPIGTTTVTYTALDACGETEMCSFDVTVNPAPTGEIDLVCNDDIIVTETVGENDGVVVTYNDPTATTTCSLGGVEVEQTAGLASGSTFPIGTTTVTYTALDACGETETCSFDVTVNPAPTGEITFTCSDDIEVTEAVGETGVMVTYNDPTATTTCPIGTVGMTLISGLSSGSVFPVGTTTVIYEAVDRCGGMERCAFIVKVNPAPTGEIFLTCAEDQTITVAFDESTAVVNYEEPIAISSCELDGLNVTLVEGLASGSEFPIGESLVVFEATDACGEVERCSLTITVVQLSEPTGSIGDFVFTDLDEDGVQDDNEPGVDGVTVKLIDSNNNTVATDVTENNGAYEFTEVEAGAYQIMVNAPDGMVLSPANQGGDDTEDSDILENGMTAVFTLVPGQDKTDVDAGLIKPIVVEKVKVGDIVFNDANGNGIQDNGEAGIEDVFIQLLDEDGEVLQFTTSDDNGMYMFSELEPGNYQLRFMGQSNDLMPTTQDEGGDDTVDSDIDENGLTDVFTLVADFDDTRDAGFTPRIVEPDPARIGNQVFLDENRNGTRDDNETGIDGVEVKLIGANGDILQTVNTANGGMYAFVVMPGSYQIMFGTPFGFNPTNQSGNATDGVDNDSDNDPATGMTELFTVVAGDVNPTIDAGFVTIPEPCDNVTDGGKIEADEDPEACGPYDAAIITDLVAPTGGTGELEYIWLASTDACPTELTDMIPGANGSDYDPGVLTQTTYFVRCARRVGCSVWIESDCVVKTVDACDNGGSVDCDAVTATVDGGKVTVDGLVGSNAKVEVIGAGTNWTPMLVCGDGGEACENPQMITDLPEGDYTVKVQLWGADGSYCYTERQVTVVDEGEPTCTVDGGTISTNDDTTDLCVGDNEPSIVNFTVTGSNGPNSAWVVTDNNGTILNADAPSSIDFEGAGAGTCFVYYLRYENITGLEAGANIDDLAGCFDKSNRIEVSRTDNCGGEEPTCEDVVVTTGNGRINLVGLSAPFVVVKIHDINAGWAIIEECVGCEDPTTFTVPEGDYNVVIEFYRGFWNDKYCRRDVTVTVGGNDSCTDADGDGVCFEEDCDDNDASIGARQTAGTSCDDGNDLTINDVIQADGCTCAGAEDTTPEPEKEICIEREVFNTDNCQFNIIYGLFLKLDGYDEYYTVSDASFIEYTDGTALYTATAINNTTPGIGWDIEVAFGNRTTLAEVAPKQHNCLAADVNEFYFYETLEGQLTGINDVAGASMDITRVGPAFQLGIGANITHNAFDFGGGGWFVADMLTQPTNGLSLVLNEGAQGQNGDININLSGDGTECIDGRDNSELDCANVTAIATADGITISGLTAPIEIVKVFDANWVPVDNCTGDCGESMTVAAGPGNYVVRVNFYTANWIGECEVDIQVTVPASANGASSRNAPQLSVNTFEDNRAITVEWLTNTGYKNQSYVIEKSTDGATFKVIAEVFNTDNTDELTYYKGIDNNPVLGANYYRVRQVYVGGSFEHSDVQVVNYNIDLDDLAVFPNPAKEALFVNLKNYAGKKANIQVINNYGQVLQQLAIDEIPAQAIRLDLSDVQNGLYHLSIRVDNSNVVTKKVLVNRLY